MGVVQKQFCPDCGKEYECTARQQMHHMMSVHPVKQVGLKKPKKGKSIMTLRSGKRSYISALIGMAKRHAKDSGVSATLSAGSPKLHHMSRNISFEFATAENLACGLDNRFLFRVYNTFHGVSHPTMIWILQSSDLTMLVAEAEDIQVNVSELI